MTVRDITFGSIETAVNSLLNLDGRASNKLKRYHAKVIQVELRGTGVSFFFIPDQNGLLQVLSRYEGDPDCIMSGSPLDLMRASDKSQGAAQLFAGHVSITGDTELGHRFSEILGSLDIDWEEILSHYTGDIAAHEIGRFIRKFIRQSAISHKSFNDNLSEFLTEEAQLLPHRYQVEDFLDEIDQLRDDCARLEARLKILEQKRDSD